MKLSQVYILKVRLGGEISWSDVNMHNGYCNSSYFVQYHYITHISRNGEFLANNHFLHKVFFICFVFSGPIDFSLFCLNSAQKCLILPEECSPQKSLILLEILPAEFIQAHHLFQAGIQYQLQPPSLLQHENIFHLPQCPHRSKEVC